MTLRFLLALLLGASLAGTAAAQPKLEFVGAGNADKTCLGVLAL